MDVSDDDGHQALMSDDGDESGVSPEEGRDEDDDYDPGYVTQDHVERRSDFDEEVDYE